MVQLARSRSIAWLGFSSAETRKAFIEVLIEEQSRTRPGVCDDNISTHIFSPVIYEVCIPAFSPHIYLCLCNNSK